MRKPTQMEVFDALYTLAAGGGRKEALFGNSYELARPAFERTLIGKQYPVVHIEFPLLGEPCFDLLTSPGMVEAGDRFAPGAGFGHQATFDWYASVCEQYGALGCGFELDLSAGETERAAVYFQQFEHYELVEPFLATVGEAERARDYHNILNRMPKGWPPAYVGLFPGRPGTPMRMGGYLDLNELTRCGEDPSHLGECFRQIGFSAFDDTMLVRCTELIRLAPLVDFQFDITTEGRLGNTFGLSLGFSTVAPREAKECMESGYGTQIMQMLQGWGLADDRWKLVADAAFARHVGYTRDDGSEGRFALCTRFNFAKVKFKACEAQPAKFYLTCDAGDMERA